MAPTRRQSKYLALSLSSFKLMKLVLTLFFFHSISLSSAQTLVQGKGLWVPVDGELGRRSLSHITSGGNQDLYAVGSGVVWHKKQLNTTEQEQESLWTELGRYAPLLTWDEAIGVNASGPFSSELLSEVERQVGESIEAALDGQGDEDWITEDAALNLIESFEDEVSPAVDSPYRVNGVFPQQKGIWLATGAGLWATSDHDLIPLKDSPAPSMNIIQLDNELWVSTDEAVVHTQDYLSYASQESGQKLEWVQHDADAGSGLIHYQNSGFILSEDKLVRFDKTGTDQMGEIPLPVGTYHVYSETDLTHTQPSNRLWALNQDALWYAQVVSNRPVTGQSLTGQFSTGQFSTGQSLTGQSLTGQSLTWQQCISLPTPMTHIKVNEAGILVIASQEILSVSSDCQKVERYEPPLGEGVIFTDAAWWQKTLYASTSGGLFIWEAEGSSKLPKVALQYLKRDLEIFPRFFEVYQAALVEQGLDPASNGYGARPVISALCPQLTMRYSTQPSRVDTVPTFSIGSRQLSLIQPRPEYSIFLEWRISLDFLSALVDPERGSAYYETQNQIDSLVDDPLATSEMESEIGVLDDWTNDTFTSQVQRLAMTTLALERRQKHRDRAQLRSQLARLHRERVKLTYRRWLQLDLNDEQRLNESKLKLQEIDAHLDAMSGYRLQIQDKMTPSL